jgi:hypothetical protein
MNTALSDLLKHTRTSLDNRLFLTPGEIRNLLKRFNTFVALAEDIEDELHLRELREHRDRVQGGCVVLRFSGASLVFGRRDDRERPA